MVPLRIDFEGWLRRGSGGAGARPLIERALAELPAGGECFRVGPGGAGRVLEQRRWLALCAAARYRCLPLLLRARRIGRVGGNRDYVSVSSTVPVDRGLGVRAGVRPVPAESRRRRSDGPGGGSRSGTRCTGASRSRRRAASGAGSSAG